MTDDPFSRAALVQTEAFTRLRLQHAVHKAIPGSDRELLEWRDTISQDPSLEAAVGLAFERISDRILSFFKKPSMELTDQELDELALLIGAAHTPEGSLVVQKEGK